jgi:hypothetical protein
VALGATRRGADVGFAGEHAEPSSAAARTKNDERNRESPPRGER